MGGRTRTILFGAVVAALALGAGLALRAAMDGRGGPSPVAVELGAPFELVDHHGAPVTEAAFEGAPSLLFFGFTHCPDVCPTTVWEIDNWVTALEAEGVDTSALRAWFVTVDPERDTPEFLRDYLTSLSDRVVGITGEPEAVWDMARSWRIYWQKRPLGEGEYTIDHYASIFVLDEEGRVADLIAYGEDAETAKAKIRGVL